MVDSRSWRRRCSPPSARRPCARRSPRPPGASRRRASLGRRGVRFEDDQRFGQFNGLTDKGLATGCSISTSSSASMRPDLAQVLRAQRRARQSRVAPQRRAARQLAVLHRLQPDSQFHPVHRHHRSRRDRQREPDHQRHGTRELRPRHEAQELDARLWQGAAGRLRSAGATIRTRRRRDSRFWGQGGFGSPPAVAVQLPDRPDRLRHQSPRGDRRLRQRKAAAPRRLLRNVVQQFQSGPQRRPTASPVCRRWRCLPTTSRGRRSWAAATTSRRPRAATSSSPTSTKPRPRASSWRARPGAPTWAARWTRRWRRSECPPGRSPSSR